MIEIWLPISHSTGAPATPTWSASAVFGRKLSLIANRPDRSARH
jgi:hypothetical protein